MKIMILHKHLLVGGTEKVLITLTHLLQQMGHDIHVLITYKLNNQYESSSLFHENIHCDFVFHELQQRELLIQNRKKSLWHKLRYEIFKWQEHSLYNQAVNHAIQQYQPDVLIDFSGCLDKWIRQFKWLQKHPRPRTLRWVHGQLNGSNPLSPKQIKKYRQIFTKHHRVVCICPQMAEIIGQTLHLPKHLLNVIFNPIDIRQIRQEAEKNINLPFNAPYLLQVARLAQGKGHEAMLDIFAKLKQHGIPHKLVLIGDGENRAILEDKVKRLNLQEECYFLGEIANPYPYFKQASLFLHTSEHEGLGVVILESMALGVPVVAMDCPTGPKDILGANSEYGKLIPMHQQDDFVQAVLDLLHDDVLYQHYQAQSLLRIHDFSMENMAQQLENLLQAA